MNIHQIIEYISQYKPQNIIFLIFAFIIIILFSLFTQFIIVFYIGM